MRPVVQEIRDANCQDVRGLYLLVSQGVISRNYDDSQYDGFDS
jgi:hypothetical protein